MITQLAVTSLNAPTSAMRGASIWRDFFLIAIGLRDKATLAAAVLIPLRGSLS
jgi:hypothetical protein